MSSRHQRDIESAYELLTDERRRRALSLLDETDVRAVDELAGLIAARERDETVGDVDESARKRVHVSLVHNHLPRLADHGVVAYDPDAGTVEPAEGFDDLEPFVAHFGTADGDQHSVDELPCGLPAD